MYSVGVFKVLELKVSGTYLNACGHPEQKVSSTSAEVWSSQADVRWSGTYYSHSV